MSSVKSTLSVGAGAAEVEAFVANIRNSKVAELNLSDNSISVSSWDAVVQGLTYTQSVNVIDFSGNELEYNVIVKIANMLHYNESVRKLNLRNTNCGRDACIVLGDALADNTTLEQLDLSYNNIFNEGCSNIVKKSPNLTVLQFEKCRISGFEGEKAISELLKMPCLEYLNLSKNRFTANILDAIVGNKTVRRVDLSDCGIHLYDGRDFFANTTLRSINLSYNTIEGNGLQGIGLGMKVNRTLREIRMEGNQAKLIMDDDIRPIVESLKENAVVQNIVMDAPNPSDQLRDDSFFEEMNNRLKLNRRPIENATSVCLALSSKLPDLVAIEIAGFLACGEDRNQGRPKLDDNEHFRITSGEVGRIYEIRDRCREPPVQTIDTCIHSIRLSSPAALRKRQERDYEVEEERRKKQRAQLQEWEMEFADEYCSDEDEYCSDGEESFH